MSTPTDRRYCIKIAPDHLIATIALAPHAPTSTDSADTVLAEFKKRLGRIGIEYQTPARP